MARVRLRRPSEGPPRPEGQRSDAFACRRLTKSWLACPTGSPKPKNPIRIRWSLVCMGYQPELAAAWSACTTSLRRGGEAGPGLRGEPLLDRDPHDPLLLLNGPLRNAARGRGPGPESSRRTDPSPRIEGLGHRYPQVIAPRSSSRRSSRRRPWAIDDEDRGRLVAHFGRERALDVIWWASRCHYMTRVADGFQLPLERENVFAPLPAPAEKAKTP